MTLVTVVKCGCEKQNANEKITRLKSSGINNWSVIRYSCWSCLSNDSFIQDEDIKPTWHFGISNSNSENVWHNAVNITESNFFN